MCLFNEIGFDFVFGNITEFVFLVCMTENYCAAWNHSFGEIEFFQKLLVIIEESDRTPDVAGAYTEFGSSDCHILNKNCSIREVDIYAFEIG